MKKFLFILFFPLGVFCQTEGLITSGNSTLYFRTFGSGRPLLIINGGPGMNSNGFVALAQKLSKDRMTIVYDQRGTGKSTIAKIDSQTITMDQMVSDIENLRNHLNIEKWDVLGHSFGGMLASHYAVKFPNSIDRMIMSSSGGVDLGLLDYVGRRTSDMLSVTERDSLEFWNRKLNAGDTTFKARIGRGRALAPAYVYNKDHVKTIAQRLTEGNSEINAIIWQDLRRINFDCTQKLSGYQKPVLIIQGKDDLLEIQTAEKIRTTFKNSNLILLDKCGHYGWLDSETEYFSAIDNFLKTS